MTVSCVLEKTNSNAFSSFIELFDKASTISSKAQNMIGVEMTKFDSSEKEVFNNFLSSFVSNHHHQLDIRTIERLLDTAEQVEHLDYSNAPLPFNQIETTDANLIDFN